MDDGTLGPETVVTGLPEGAKINFVTWYIPRIHLVYFYLSSYEICIVSGQSLKNRKKKKKKKKVSPEKEKRKIKKEIILSKKKSSVHTCL